MTDDNGNIVAFKTPHGNILRLVIALEVEDNINGKYEYITEESRMAERGFEALDYDECYFEEGQLAQARSRPSWVNESSLPTKEVKSEQVGQKKSRNEEFREIAATIYKLNPLRSYDAIEICEMVSRGVPGVDRQELTVRQGKIIWAFIYKLDTHTWDGLRWKKKS